MAQYYNLVTNSNGTLTIEDVSQYYSVDGQRVQLVTLENINNGGNDSSEYLSYTAAQQNNEQTTYSPQTFSIGGHIATAQLDPRQNVFIIKSNQASVSQSLLKTDTVEVQLVEQNLVNNEGIKTIPVNSNLEGQQMQWLNTQDDNVNLNSILKENIVTPIQLLTPIKNQQQNNITISNPGQFSQTELVVQNSIERKDVKSYQNRSQNSQGSVQTSSLQNNPQSRNTHTILALNKNSTAPAVKSYSHFDVPVHPGSTESKNVGTSPMSKNVPSLYSPEMEHLNERIRHAKKITQKNTQQQQQQVTRPQVYVTPQQKVTQTSFVHRQQSPNVITHQIRPSTAKKPLTVSGQRQPALVPRHSLQRQQQSTLTQQQRQVVAGTPQRQQLAVVPQRQQSPVTPVSRQIPSNIVQRQPQTMGNVNHHHHQQQQQQRPEITPHQRSLSASPRRNASLQPQGSAVSQFTSRSVTEAIDTTHEDENMDQSILSNADSETLNESFAILKEVIKNPQTAIVQKQIEGRTAKMLVALVNGEQRLITFDIPHEDCTVHDLLEQAAIPFGHHTTVSLVSDPSTIGINYIVDTGSESMSNITDTDQVMQEISNTKNESSSQSVNISEENSEIQLSSKEQPKYIAGKLAVCAYCGQSSADFNRCERCRRPLPEDVKTRPVSSCAKSQEKKGIHVNTFYKKSPDQNTKIEKLEKENPHPKRISKPRKPIKKPVPKEPECLTISSDEEEGADKSRKLDELDNTNVGHDDSVSVSSSQETILEKEPIITNNTVIENHADSGGGGSVDFENVGITDIQANAPQTSIACRTVRIGSYKYIPREDVIITPNGIRLGVPLLEDEKSCVTLDVKINHIIKVLTHFGKSMPVLFFYTSTNSGAMIRELLGMQDPKGLYYDPASKDHTHKRISLLPDVVSEDSKFILKQIFQKKLEELNLKEANEILVRASPKDCASVMVQTPSKKPVQPVSAVNSDSSGGIQTITVYPPPPAKGGIAINTEDYSCLGEDQFLNDVIIDFYLKYLTLEVLSPSDQNRTHVFSSYFYKRLTSPHAQAAESTEPLSPAAKRHARVQKWTKNVNIFQKDFIIIPINEHAHWFLAIICFPGLVGKVLPNLSSAKESKVSKLSQQKSKQLKEVKSLALTIGNTTITPVTTTITLDQADDGSERDEASGDDEEMEMDSDEDDETEARNEGAAQVKLETSLSSQKIVKMPCILIFDSLAGASRSRVVATLRDYLQCEHKAKLGTEKVFSKDTIKGSNVKVPQQSNFTDCGLYVLQYVESFFKDPIKDYTLPIKTLRNWFEEIVVTRKREELSQLLIKLMNETKGDRNITLPSVIFPTQDGKLKPKSETTDSKASKSEVESKKKVSVESENRTNTNVSSSIEGSDIASDTTSDKVPIHQHKIVPYTSSSSSSPEGNPTDQLLEVSSYRSSCSETMIYLKKKRISRIVQKQSENHDHPDHLTKKYKGDSSESCK